MSCSGMVIICMCWQARGRRLHSVSDTLRNQDYLRRTMTFHRDSRRLPAYLRPELMGRVCSGKWTALA